MYSVENGTAYWTPDAEEWMYWGGMSKDASPLPDGADEFDRRWNAYEYTNPEGTGGYRTRMSPEDFLRLTQGDDYEGFASKYGLSTELDKDRFERYDMPIFLEFDTDTGNVLGHEGRHRSYALMKNGVTDMDVRLIPRGKNFDKYHPKNINGIWLKQQERGKPIASPVWKKIKTATPLNKKTYDERKSDVTGSLFGRTVK